MSSIPTTLTELIAFVKAKAEGDLSETPEVEELSDFANDCHTSFQNKFGESTPVYATPHVMRTMVHLVPMTDMAMAMDAVKDLESEFRILTAADFSQGLIGDTLNSATLVVEPLEKLVYSTCLYHNNGAVLAGYGHNIPNELRPVVVTVTIKLSCIISSLWGFLFAYDEPEMTELHKVVDDFAARRLPNVPDEQRGHSFSRSGMVLGWNTAMVAVDSVFKDRSATLAAATPDIGILLAVMQSACRSAMSATATTFSRTVKRWVWNNGITFSKLNEAFDLAFQLVVQEVAPLGDDDAPLHFSLTADTTTVREVRPPPTSQTIQETPGDGRSYVSRVLNVPDRIVKAFSFGLPAKRARLNVATPQEVTASFPARPHGNSTQPPPPPQPQPGPNTAAQAEAQLRRSAAVEQEVADMRRNAARRIANRIRNREMHPGRIWDEHKYNIRAIRNILDGRDQISYENDNPDSENEDLDTEQDRADAATNAGDVEERISVEKFLLFVVNQYVDPFCTPHHKSEDSIVNDYRQYKNHLVKFYLEQNRSLYLYEATRALNTDQYSDHLKALLYLETNFQMQRALFETFPRLLPSRRTEPIVHELTDRGCNQRYFFVRVKTVARTRSLFELVCTPFSTNHNIRRSLIRAFPGQTVCAGIVFNGRSRSQFSRLTFVVCRSISIDQQATNAMDGDAEEQLDFVTVRLSASRYHLDNFRPGREVGLQTGDVLHLIPFCNIVSSLRQLKSIHASFTLPDSMQQILFGASFQAVRQLPNTDYPESRHQLKNAEEPIDAIRARVDPGCLAYVDALPDHSVDTSQRRALLTSLGEMGQMQPNSSFLSLIVGPPGCGKSWTIALLCMTLLHHSRVGHCRPNATYPSVLPEPPRILRCSDNRDGLSILVTCPSNCGTDEVARKLRDQLPMPDGSTMRPHIVRITRLNYDLKDLHDISLHQLALQYDLEFFNPVAEGEQPRRHPSMDAKDALINEACIFLTTNATAAGPLLDKLGVRVSAVIIDEAAHSSEGESLMSIMANVRLAQGNRVHAVLVGDMKQLGPVFMSSHAAIKHVGNNRSFTFRPSMRKQMQSLFERLYRAERCKASMLTNHYRSHPDIAAVTLTAEYSDILIHPRPREQFVTPFSNIPGQQGLSLVTIVDTRLSVKRFEGRCNGSSDGPLTNDIELHLIEEFLRRVRQHRGDFDLNDNIMVASPYVQQVQRIREHLTAASNFCSPRSPDFNVMIDTTDATQGAERSVAVISLTRSNTNNDIGFLNDPRRLNVAFSRARNCLIIIGDFSTMANSSIASHVYTMVSNGAPGTSLQFYEPPTHLVDPRQRYEVQRMRMHSH